MNITWWGHATVAIADGGSTILTDPVLRNRLAHLRRRRGPTPRPARPDAVVLSHLHADHCDLVSLRTLPASTRLIAPAGAGEFLRAKLNRDVTELAVGAETTVGALRVQAVPASHDGSRMPHSSVKAEAVGYKIIGSRTAWFAGDTGLFDEMKDLGPVDLALVPVWGWGWSLGPGHLDPERAAEAMGLVNPGLAVPIHWGTLWPMGCAGVRPDRFALPGDEFAAHAARTSPRTDVRVLAPGESLDLAAAA